MIPNNALRTKSARRARHLATAAMLALGSELTGCVTTRPASPSVTPQIRNTDLVALADRERLLNSLETPAVMEYTGPNGHLKARERIVVRRPASLRVEALSPLGVALIVAADSQQIAIFDPAKDTITRGAATAATLSRVMQIPLAPEQAVRLLLALPPDVAIMSSSLAPAEVDDGMTALTYTRADGMVDKIAFLNGNLALVRETNAAGSLAYEVRYTDYQDIGAMQFPHAIEARFPAIGTAIKLRYESPAIDRVIPDSAFILSPGSHTREWWVGMNTTNMMQD